MLLLHLGGDAESGIEALRVVHPTAGGVSRLLHELIDPNQVGQKEAVLGKVLGRLNMDNHVAPLGVDVNADH